MTDWNSVVKSNEETAKGRAVLSLQSCLHNITSTNAGWKMLDSRRLELTLILPFPWTRLPQSLSFCPKECDTTMAHSENRRLSLLISWWSISKVKERIILLHQVAIS